MKKTISILLVLMLVLSACSSQRDDSATTETIGETSTRTEAVSSEISSPSETATETDNETAEETSPFEETSSEEAEMIQTDPVTDPAVQETYNPAGEEPLLVMETKVYPNFDEMSKGGTLLSDKELQDWNDAFNDFQAVHFLVTDYETPEEISLYYLFHDGVLVDIETGEMLSREATPEEIKLLEEKSEVWRNRPAEARSFKVERKQMEAVLKSYMGVTLENTKQYGLKNFTYLEETDSYYFMMNELHANRYEFTAGAYLEDGSLLLQWKLTENYCYSIGDTGYVRLEKNGEIWKIVSNVMLHFENRPEEPLICLYKGTLESVQEKVMKHLHERMHEEGISNLVEFWDPLTPFSVFTEDDDYCLIFTGGGMDNFAKNFGHEPNQQFLQMIKDVRVALKDPNLSLKTAVIFIPWDQAAFAFSVISPEELLSHYLHRD